MTLKSRVILIFFHVRIDDAAVTTSIITFEPLHHYGFSGHLPTSIMI